MAVPNSSVTKLIASLWGAMMRPILARPSCLAPAPSGVGIRRKYMEGIYQGDALSVLKTLPSQSIQTCVTSPPYFGLRDYGMFGQIGLEETPEAFTQKLVDVFREVRRVLKDDGTLWLNLGDSYAGSGKGGQSSEKRSENWQPEYGNKGKRYGLKPKDLIGIPWRVAFALQADGWYLRQDIIWHKPNPMPESVTDRCTKAHEYIFLLSKSPKYYFDNEAIQEPAKYWGERDRTNGKYHNEGTGLRPHSGLTGVRADKRAGKGRIAYEGKRTEDTTGANGQESFVSISEKRNKRSVWTITTKPYKGAHFATFPSDLIEPCILAGAPLSGLVLDPFLGSGTTAAVAKSLGRQYVGIELNPEYIKLANKRIGNVQLPIPLIAAE